MDYLNVKTVVIGSGVAGIACGINLLRNNYDDFVVFEAQDRIGGRVCTVDFNKSYLEMGAQYIHGQEENPIYYIARDYKQIDEKYNEIISDDENIEDNNGIPIDLDNESSYLFATQFGEKIDMDLAYEMYNTVNKIIREAKDYYLDKNSTNDKSAGQFAYEKYCELIKTRFANVNSKEEQFLRKLISGFLVWRCKSENIEIGCHSVSDISMKNYCVFKDLRGSQIIEPNFGYRNILSFLIKDYQKQFNSRLRLKHALKKILICSSQSDCLHCSHTPEKDRIVLIITDLDSTKDLIVICENVVCTMSLGYMKDNLARLIEPNSFIPKEKLLAVSRLGYGTVNKIFLVYDKPFWESTLSGIQPIWLFNETKSNTVLNKLENFNESNWFESISYFSTVKNHSNILSAWLGGCSFVEKLSDEKISKDCTMVLRKFLNNNSIPEPTNILKSTWNSNPCFRGSYTFLPMGSEGTIDLNNLAEPIYDHKSNKPMIMFAGEATSATQFSTVHGAYHTGIRESERILKNNKLNLIKN